MMARIPPANSESPAAEGDQRLSATIQPAPKTPFAWKSLAPGIFVLLWASGFISGKLGLPYARPFTILLMRFAIATVFMVGVSLATRANWPKTLRQAFHVGVVGVLLQAVYLAGCYGAMAEGIPAGVTALIVGLQPILTATVVGPFLGEKVNWRQWLGLAIGFTGVALVLWDKLDFSGLEVIGFLYALGGLLGITSATIYQKRFCGAVDLRTSAAIQYAAASLILLPLAWAFGFGQIHWTGTFIFTLAWLVLVLSSGAFSLLLWLIRKGAASKVASLFYLTPPMAALGGYLVFGETLAWPALAGMALAAVGVALVNRG
jgi:drug/metabolite transporter (DMT)-like permease